MFALAYPLIHINLKAKNNQPTVCAQGNWLLEELPSFPPDTHPALSHKDKAPDSTHYVPDRGLFLQSYLLDHATVQGNTYYFYTSL